MRTRLIPLLVLPLFLAACGGPGNDAQVNAANAAGVEPSAGNMDPAPAQEPAPATAADNAAAAAAAAAAEARAAAEAPYGWEMCNPQPPAQVVMTGPTGIPVYSAPRLCPRQGPIAVNTQRAEGPRAVQPTVRRPSTAANASGTSPEQN